VLDEGPERTIEMMTTAKMMRLILAGIAGIAVLFISEEKLPTPSPSRSLRRNVPSSDSITPANDRNRMAVLRLSTISSAANETLLVKTGEKPCGNS
jgi:hypothetical protein